MNRPKQLTVMQKTNIASEEWVFRSRHPALISYRGLEPVTQERIEKSAGVRIRGWLIQPCDENGKGGFTRLWRVGTKGPSFVISLLVPHLLRQSFFRAS
jgi:hypothetical protein